MDSYIDVNYNDVESKKPTENVLYYTIGEVAKELGEESSTIRYWSNKYHDLLDVELCNTHRRYTRLDIDKLRIVQKCKAKNMSHNQIINTLKETNFDIAIIEKNFDEVLNPLDLQVLTAALAVEVENQIMAMEDRIIQRMQEHMQSQIAMNERALESIREEVATTVDEIVSEKLSDFNEANIEEFKRVNEKLDRIAYVSSEEISKQKKDAPNKWWRWFKGEK